MKTEWFERTLCCIGAMLAASLVLLVALQVASREVIQLPITVWSEEASRLASVYLVFVGAAVAVIRKTNLRVTFFVDMLPPRVAAVSEIIANIAAMFFSIIVVAKALEVGVLTWSFPMTTIPISAAWIFMAIPLGMIPMVIVFALRAWKLIKTIGCKDGI
jgi:TRAP-type transport system small permease protein